MNTISKLVLVILTIVNFPTAILDRLRLLKGEVKYNLRNGISFFARSGTEDLAEIAVVASGSEYKTESIDLPSNSTIVDLGGHIGTFSVLTAKQLRNRCKIYTFEPDIENFKILQKNIILNKITSVYPKNIAISDYVGKGYLKTEKMNTDAYHLALGKNKKNNCIVNTLPYALREHRIKKINLLKMDIEGEERNIFKHKASLTYIKKMVHYIFIEIDPHYGSSQMKKIIDENFIILNRHKNILTLENLNSKYD